MAHDPEKVPEQHADIFYHGMPDGDGHPVGLTDEEYDGLKAERQAAGTWPLDPVPSEEDHDYDPDEFPVE